MRNFEVGFQEQPSLERDKFLPSQNTDHNESVSLDALTAERQISEQADQVAMIEAREALERAYSKNKPERKGFGEFQEHEVIIPDDETKAAADLLKIQNIIFEERVLSKQQQVNTDSWIPGESVFSLYQNKEKEPAPGEAIRQIFQFLKERGITIRYAKVPKS
jgi:hypothetical protein